MSTKNANEKNAGSSQFTKTVGRIFTRRLQLEHRFTYQIQTIIVLLDIRAAFHTAHRSAIGCDSLRATFILLSGVRQVSYISFLFNFFIADALTIITKAQH